MIKLIAGSKIERDYIIEGCVNSCRCSNCCFMNFVNCIDIGNIKNWVDNENGSYEITIDL